MKRILIVTLLLLLTIMANFMEAKTHVVQSGDTLYQISQKYGLTISELKEMNALNSDVLRVGQVLKVGYDNGVADQKTSLKKGDETSLFDLKFGLSKSQVKTTLSKHEFSHTCDLNDASLYENKQNKYIDFILVNYDSRGKIYGWVISYKESVTKAQFASVCQVLSGHHGENYRVVDGAFVWDLGYSRSCAAGPAGGNYIVVYGPD